MSTFDKSPCISLGIEDGTESEGYKERRLDSYHYGKSNKDGEYYFDTKRFEFLKLRGMLPRTAMGASFVKRGPL